MAAAHTGGHKALVLSSSVAGGASSQEAQRAAANGFTITMADDQTWVGMTATDFAQYDLIIVGDADSSVPRVVSQNATALADAVMARSGGRSVPGNRVLIGTDPIAHPGQKLIQTAVDFAGSRHDSTNLYLCFQNRDPDYDGNGIPDAQDKLLPKLTVSGNGTWTQNTSPPCGGNVSLIANAAQFSTLKTSDIQGWGCSVHESFPQYPTEWLPLAIATDTPTKPTCGTDVDTKAAACGEAYILIAGSGGSDAPNLKLAPKAHTGPAGVTHTVTASVIKNDGSANPDILVNFIVTGVHAGATGTCAPANCTSDAAGQVTYTYLGTKTGDDSIIGSINLAGTVQTATAGKTWGTAPPPPAFSKIVLAPASASPYVLTQQCVTATALDSADKPVGAINLAFSVTGVNPRSGNALTSANGTAGFCWTGNVSGIDNAVAKAQGITSNAAKITWQKRPTAIAVGGYIIADGQLTPVTVSSNAILTDALNGKPLGSKLVRFTAGTGSCKATTKADGSALCTMGFVAGSVPSLLSGGYTGSFAGDAQYAPVSKKGSLICSGAGCPRP